MIKRETINFKASVNAPNPEEVSYWIDLSMDRDGNIIKSYRPDVKKWIPLNRDANVDQWQHIQEIVDACGLDFNHETDVISLPNLSSNHYFKGSSIINAINNGDSAVKSQVTRLDGRIDDTNNRVQAHKDEVDGKLTTINTNISNINNRVNTLEDQVDDLIAGGGGGTGGDTSALEKKVNDLIASKGQANGLATLGSTGKIPESQLPSYVDDVLEFASLGNFPITGESGKIYVTTDTNLTYRWSGTTYVEISPSLALGETSSTAYAGNKGKATTDSLNTHLADTTNPHSVTKAQVGLANVNNTSDLDKPISTATQNALNTITNTLNSKISGTGVTNIEVVSALPESPVATTLYIVVSE